MTGQNSSENLLTDMDYPSQFGWEISQSFDSAPDRPRGGRPDGDGRRSNESLLSELASIKRREKKLIEARDLAVHARRRAERENAVKDHILAETSHELRGPLNVISLYLGSLLHDPQTSNDQRELLETSQFHLRIAARIVDDLQNSFKAQGRKLSVELVPLNLHNLIHVAIDGFRQELADAELKLEMDLAATCQEVNGDAGRLLQVLWNLLRNAIKFTPAGGTIRVRTFNEELPELVAGPFVTLEVCDDGVGLDGSDLERIFLPFQQVSPDDRDGPSGLGLGLTLCRHLAELHDGTLAAHSRGVGFGSVFALRVPTLPALGVETPLHLQSESGSTTSVEFPRPIRAHGSAPERKQL